MKKLLLSVLLMLLPLLASADPVEINGIWYYLTIKTKEAEVTRNPNVSSSYSGSIEIPKSVTYYNEEYSVTTIGKYAFNGCSGITSVSFPDGLKKIDQYAFQDCTGLTSVSIGSDNVPSSSGVDPLPPGSSPSYGTSTTSIGAYAFYGCSNISSVTLGKSVTSIGYYAFDGCSIETVTIPSTIQYLGGHAFGSNLKSIYTSDLGWLLRMTFSIDTKDQHRSYPILAGVEHLFVDGKELVDLELENKKLGNYLFYGFKGLKSLKIKGSLTLMGTGCWALCHNLESVEISEGVTSITEESFEGCSKLMSIKIPTTVTSIGKNAFSRTGIYNSQADGIYYVDNWACGYKGNTDENTVFNVRDGVVGISDIPEAGFMSIPASVKYVTNFSSRYTLRNVRSLILDSQNCLEKFSFERADKLETLILGNAISTIPKEKFTDLKNLKTVLFGFGLRDIKSGAFSGCEGLEKVRIPNGVTTIGDYAFYNCKGLTTLTIPGSVTTIGSFAFGNCMSLVSVNSFINVPKVISENVFGCRESGYDAKTIYYISTLYVPRGRTTIYNNVSSWNLFSNIQEIDVAYELTYVLDNEIYKSIEIQEGITVTPETDPVKDGYVFSGWKTVPETMPASDVIVFGEFRPYKKVEIADIVNCVFGRSGITYNEDFDTNHDGKVDVADIVTAIKQRK